MTPEPSVGAVVVNYNGGEKLLRCVRALRMQDDPLREILVVDNGSTDGSIERMRAANPEVRTIELRENRGLPVARNVGLRELGTELVLSVDSDIYLEPACLSTMKRAYLDREASVVCPRIVLWPGGTTAHCDGASVHFLGTLTLRHGFRPVERLPEAGAPVGAFPGGCLLFDRERVRAAGGFDDLYFFYLEDLELSFRLRSRGHRFFCEPAAVVRHDLGDGTPGLSFRGEGPYPARRAYLIMRNRWLSILIHYHVRTMIVLLPVLLAYELGTLTAAILRGWPGAWARAWGWLLVHRRAVSERRRRAQAARKTRDRAILEGGPIPLAPGFVRSSFTRGLVATFSAGLNLYWKLARRFIG